MSLILKGIDLPKDEKKPLKIEIWPNGDIYKDYGYGYEYKESIAVQIPKGHGRMIDADNIDYDDFWHREGQGFTIAVCQGAQRIIEEQPTILEARE